MLAWSRSAALLLAACWLAPPAAGADEVVDWRDAARCVDRVCGVRGTVALAEDDGPTIRLYFDAADRGVRVILMRGWLVTWPRYEGQTIVATGRVGRFRDHVELILADPSAIEVIGGTPTATPSLPPATPTASAPAATATAAVTVAPTSEPTALPTSAPTPAPAPPPGEVERLRERVRELEERLRRLESQP